MTRVPDRAGMPSLGTHRSAVGEIGGDVLSFALGILTAERVKSSESDLPGAPHEMDHFAALGQFS